VKIHTIHLDDEDMPASIVATLTATEAAFLQRVVGGMPCGEIDRLGVSGVYEPLSRVFNSFYDGGVEDFPSPHPPAMVRTSQSDPAANTAETPDHG
jgi:hypothetical protein